MRISDWSSTCALPISSVFRANLPISEKLDRARVELLDLSARNRLLNIPRSSKGGRSIAVIDEKSTEIFRLLVRDGRPFTFVPGKSMPDQELGEASKADEIAELAQPEADETDRKSTRLNSSH